MKKLFELVKVLDLEPIQAGDGEEFRFRLEIFREINTDSFSGKIYRLETYRLHPTFPQSNGELPDFMHDALIYVVDDNFDLSNMKVNSLENVIKIFQDMLVQRFGDLVL